MDNKLGYLESLPELFSDTDNEIDFVHSTSSESSGDNFIQSLRHSCRKGHFLISTTCRLLTAKPKRLRTKKRVEAEDEDWMEDEDEADNEKKKKEKLSRQEGSFPLSIFLCEGIENKGTNTPTQDQRGKNANSRRVPKGDPVLVRENIKSFPVAESHYCSAHTKREYLGSHLSIGKIKLNVYNLTAYYTPTKQVYRALSSENCSCRAGNDIAGALHKILTVLTEENGMTELIAWSDSCIPQNQNSIISNSVLHFLKDNPQVK
ncbi:hypothetical protein AVEN_255293-1 [Araneus ventricosus]|uniref:Uncharacterized protein n=1 Tax=Araneus ventricosus TaxID=182803 RepID=A0A4Y2BA03_ARAVE|nr:hypothetical protein AVEN_255293-1 [Araneus ventricosus]